MTLTKQKGTVLKGIIYNDIKKKKKDSLIVTCCQLKLYQDDADGFSPLEFLSLFDEKKEKKKISLINSRRGIIIYHHISFHSRLDWYSLYGDTLRTAPLVYFFYLTTPMTPLTLPSRILSSVLSRFSRSSKQTIDGDTDANADMSERAPAQDVEEEQVLSPSVLVKDTGVPKSSSSDHAGSSSFGPKAERKRRELLDRLKEDLTCGICSNVMVRSHGMRYVGQQRFCRRTVSAYSVGVRGLGGTSSEFFYAACQ